jgi:hypothetical protein
MKEGVYSEGLFATDGNPWNEPRCEEISTKACIRIIPINERVSTTGKAKKILPVKEAQQLPGG